MTNDVSVRVYVNKIENRIIPRIKTDYYLEPLTPEWWNDLEALNLRKLKTKIVKVCFI